MSSEQELIRLAKLNKLREQGIEPYPYSFQRSHTTADIAREFAGLPNSENGSVDLSVAGRLMAIRGQGALTFADIHDQQGKIQLYIETSSLADQGRLLDLLDLGDFVGARGRAYRTRRGELSVRVSELELLTKSLKPLPDKWYGLADPELIYRRRSEYFATEPSAREIILKRALATSAVRQFLTSEGFAEVEIPLLQPVYGGASAKPFETFVNALERKNYLSISPELYLKRLIAGGFERVFSLCKNFRNENIDRTHNPEFTMMECYASYVDYEYMMDLTERLYAFVFTQVLGSPKVGYGIEGSRLGAVSLDFTPPWRRARFLDLVAEQTGIDVGEMSEEALRDLVTSGGVGDAFYETICSRDRVGEWSWGEIVGGMFECFVESQLVQPTFVIDFPKESTPLCKAHRKDPRLIERFEPYVYAMEIGNAYSELNDPVLQRKLLEDQSTMAARSDEISQRVDEDFLRAVEFGLPPTGGLGLGIDRMVMLATGALSIRDVLCFPMMRTLE